MGLRTPTPWRSTCVWIIVVLRCLWPRSSFGCRVHARIYRAGLPQQSQLNALRGLALEALGEPHFDNRLAGDAEAPSFSIERLDHP